METRAHRGRFLIIAVMLACIPSDLCAHGTVGQRSFIEPLFTEDANIKNELDLPRAEFLMLPDGSSVVSVPPSRKLFTRTVGRS